MIFDAAIFEERDVPPSSMRWAVVLDFIPKKQQRLNMT